MKERDKSLKPLHPGKILSEEFMKPMGITQYRLAKGPLGEAIANQ